MALEVEQFHKLAAQVKTAGIDFILEPHVRFEGTATLRLTFYTLIPFYERSLP